MLAGIMDRRGGRGCFSCLPALAKMLAMTPSLDAGRTCLASHQVPTTRVAVHKNDKNVDKTGSFIGRV